MKVVRKARSEKFATLCTDQTRRRSITELTAESLATAVELILPTLYIAARQTSCRSAILRGSKRWDNPTMIVTLDS